MIDMSMLSIISISYFQSLLHVYCVSIMTTFAENSSEVKETDNSYTSSQSATPDGSINSPRMVSPTVDTDLVRMESQLDSWCLDLKRNILVSTRYFDIIDNIKIVKKKYILFLNQLFLRLSLLNRRWHFWNIINRH